MTSQNPREYTKVVRDPVHGYVAIPLEVLPIVNSPFVQRLRNISQNARAVAAYPSLNGSRYEHALGTMHLCMEAWDNAWDNIWGVVDRADPKHDQASLQNEFARQVFDDAVAANKSNELQDERLRAIVERPRNAFEAWKADFPHLISLAIGVVGLLHDVGHPPFSHILEDPYREHAAKLIGDEFKEAFELYLEEVSPGTQFHEYASSVMLESILKDDSISGSLPKFLIRKIFNARSEDDVAYPSWARCIHQLIDGQIDVDRLDYIARDSLRAGTDFHAVDRQRLIGNLELHSVPNESPTWTIGVGIRGISAMEGLLAQREQSYRWMIFHQKALVADTALKRVFRHAISHAESVPLNYVTEWDAKPGTIPISYCVDDCLVRSWLRRYRLELQLADNGDSARLVALMRIFDELSSDYVPTWRTYGELLEAIESLDSGRMDLLAAAVETEPDLDEIAPSAPTTIVDSFAPLTGPGLFNKFVRIIYDLPLVLDMEIELESILHRDFGTLAGVEGVWVVAQRLNFTPIKGRRAPVWQGNKLVPFAVLSPIYAGLMDAEEKRPKVWGFFVPLHPQPDAAWKDLVKREVANAFIDALLILLREKSSTLEEE